MSHNTSGLKKKSLLASLFPQWSLCRYTRRSKRGQDQSEVINYDLIELIVADIILNLKRPSSIFIFFPFFSKWRSFCCCLVKV